MSAIPPDLQVSCDFYIREADGGWIVSYLAGFEIDEEGNWLTCHSEMVFTDELEATRFLCERMIKFKLFRSKMRVEQHAKPNWIDFMKDDLTLPKKRGTR